MNSVYKHLAIDFGSSSARVMLINNDLTFSEVGRFEHSPILIDGKYRWDIENLFYLVKKVVDDQIKKERIKSIGICSWGVDYGVIKEDGTLVDLPICYRDDRTDNIIKERDLQSDFLVSGIYPNKINTIYQLLADKKENRFKDAGAIRFGMIADLFAHYLTGNLFVEQTNASTTGLLSLDGWDWNKEEIKKIGLTNLVFPNIIFPGQTIGEYEGVEVIATCSHDTASAIYSMDNLDDNSAFISSGSWVLIGTILDRPLLSNDAFTHKLTNERGHDNKVLLLNNMNGLFVVQRLVAENKDLTYKYIDENISTAKNLGKLDLMKLDKPTEMRKQMQVQLNLNKAYLAPNKTPPRTKYQSNIYETLAETKYQPNSDETLTATKYQPNIYETLAETNCQPNSDETLTTTKYQPNIYETLAETNCQTNSDEANILDLVKTFYDSLLDSIINSIEFISKVTKKQISRLVISGGMTKVPYVMKKLNKIYSGNISVSSNEGAVLGIAKILTNRN